MWMSSGLHLDKAREKGHDHNIMDWWALPGGLCKGPGSPKSRAVNLVEIWEQPYRGSDS